MAGGARPTRGHPRERILVVERDRKARARQIEAILRRRAEGRETARIARELDLDPGRVGRVIAERRQAGDARALSDAEAAARVNARVVRAAAEARKVAEAEALLASPACSPEPALAPAVAPSPPRPRRVVRAETFAAADEGMRAGYIARLRDASSFAFSSHEHAAACFGHLADLFEHCPTFFPTYVLRDGGGTATLESTDRLFPRSAPVRSVHSSPAALCADG